MTAERTRRRDGEAAGDVVLEAEGVKKHFDQGDGLLDRLLGTGGSVKAVDGVDLAVRAGETLAVVGESGCGKSTLGQTLLNLHEPTAGTVRFRGDEVSGLSDSAMRPYRSDLQMVFQDPLASLNPRQTVGDIVTAPMQVHDIVPEPDPDVETTATVTTDGVPRSAVEVSVADDVDVVVGDDDGVATVHVSVAATEDGVTATAEEDVTVRASEREDGGVTAEVTVEKSTSELRTAYAGRLLERVGLKPSHVDRYPGQFSGGQQQRVGIARALAVDPDVIVADEPVSALDVSVQAQILNLLADLQEELGLSLVFIAHDLSVVRQVSDRVAVMYLGEVVETAPTDELFEDPDHPYTKSLLSAVPRIDPSDRTDRVTLRGSVPSPIDPPSGCRFHTRCPAVIPGEDWDGDQESFRRAFTFRNRVESGDVDADAVRERLAADADGADDDAVAARIVETTLPGDVESLPAGGADAVREAGRLLAAGDDEQAVAVLREACPSPCAADHPEPVATGDRREAACHRVDPAYDAPRDVDD